MKFREILSKNKNRILKYTKISASLVILSLLLGICMLILTVVPSDLSLIKVLVTDIRVVFLNSLPLFCIMTLFYFVTNRIWAGFLVTSVISVAFAEVNRFKMTFRDDPFIFEDLLLVSEAKNMLGMYKIFLDKATAIVLIIVAVLTVFSFFLLKKVGIRKKSVRILGVVLSAVMLVLSCNLIYFNNDSVYESVWHNEFGNRWKSANQYMSRGVVYSFIRSMPDAFLTPPDGYDKEEAEEILKKYEEMPLSDDKKVNIISIMLEAYNDFSVFKGIEFETDPYENFHKLQEDSYSGNLYTNIFSAGTIDSERAFLTGYSDVRLKDDCGNSFVRYFKNQGYYTEAMHPGYGWFYERESKNLTLGFDNFECFETKFGNLEDSELSSPKYQGLVGDIDFVDYIIEGCEKSIKNNRNYFNFSVTYENHGPYSKEKKNEKVFAVRKSNYSEAEYNIFNNYLSGISNTDKAIKKLRDYVDNSTEPVVLIFFGDHNPWLGENNSVYDMLGINLDLNATEGGKNYYQTPYVFYANKLAQECLGKDFKGEGDTVSPMFLMSEYFEYTETKGSAYLNYLQDVKKEFDVINDVYLKKNGEFVFTYTQKENQKLRERECIEYYVKSIKTE